jgi:hypothetical protein
MQPTIIFTTYVITGMGQKRLDAINNTV